MEKAYCSDSDIAIIGMSGKFPDAMNVEEYWGNILNKVNSIHIFNDEELVISGVSPNLIHNPRYVKAKGFLKNASLFDAKFFNFTSHDAEILDPQYRILLELAWEAMENSAYIPGNPNEKVGVFAGSSSFQNYYYNNIINNYIDQSFAQELQLLTLNAKDFLSSLIAYKLNLTGPCISIQTACSTSLVAICMACESLLSKKCDIALAGGISVTTPLKSGYLYQEGMIVSPDGQCRSFDVAAAGTVIGNGGGLLVLKSLKKAIEDHDYIHALIKGFAVNNDGKSKIGFSAPSIDGQQKVIQEAMNMAGVTPDQISYIETHGTATSLGDVIEIAALKDAYCSYNIKLKRNSIAIGTVKPNIGHLDVAAGIAGVIKTVQALKYKTLPPNINFTKANPQIGLCESPFYVNTTAKDWVNNNSPRIAGVSSLGMGGTNAHIVIQESSQNKTSQECRYPVLFIISAKTLSALVRQRRNISEYLKSNSEVNLECVAYTLQIGRTTFEYRFACICTSREDAIKKIEKLNEKELLDLDESSCEHLDVQLYSKLALLSKMWLSGKTVDWTALYQGRVLSKIPLPTYPFERREFWITPKNRLVQTSNEISLSENIVKEMPLEKVEALLLEIFKSFLGMDRIKSVDDFYDFGGDSLLTLQVIAEINKRLRLDIKSWDLEENSSANRLAQFVLNSKN